MNNHIFNWTDFSCLFYIPTIVLFCLSYYQKKYNLSALTYLRGLFLYLIGNLFFIWLIVFYYQAGDSINYFNFTRSIFSDLVIHPEIIDDVILANDINSLEMSKFGSLLEQTDYYLLGFSSNFFTVKFFLVLYVLCSGSFINISLIATILSYNSILRILNSFLDDLKILKKYLKYLVFFPSMLIWSNGISKESIIIFSISLVIANYNKIFIKGSLRFRYFFLFIAAGYLLYQIKNYVLLMLIPFLLLWYLNLIIKNGQYTKVLIFCGLLVILIPITGIISTSLISRFSSDNIIESIVTYGNNLTEIGNMVDGSVYSLGDFNPSLSGLISVLPAAFSTAMFRPYLWEINKPITLITSLEGLVLFIVLANSIIRIGLLRIFVIIRTHPEILFCILFSISFMTLMAITSLNYGALSRYKIPGYVFLLMSLILLNEKKNSFHNHQR